MISLKQRTTALWHRTGVQPWARIDAQFKGQSHVGALSARQAALVTVATACCMLVTLRYVVMDSDVQAQLGKAFVEIVGHLLPACRPWAQRYEALWVHLTWISGCIVVYVAVPAAVLHSAFRLPMREAFLVPHGYRRHLPIYAVLFLPVALIVVIAARQPDFQMHYPFYTGMGLWDQLGWELAYGLQFLALEFFFRGFILRGLSAEMGASAVLAMAMPYCMLHYGKPLPECVGSIVAGTVLGVLAMDTRSIWGGVTIHVAVAWTMDALALSQKGFRPVHDALNQ
ncbi:MAG: CPBP family intramembrane metalloprotease [Myxococcales bacterium]|nr:CPBP family intramembrane metalloprotease [Myxococcales bacterium]